MNKNTFGSKSHIGVGSIPLKAALPSFNTSHQLTVDLTHRGKKGEEKEGALEIAIEM